MALITKRLISDQTLFRLYGGMPDSSAPVQKEDIFKATEQLINSMYRMEQFQANLPAGETIPNGVMIATYTDVSVSGYGNFSKSTLPVIPISLPRNLGIYNIKPAMSLNLTTSFSFIPMQRGQFDLLRTDTLLNSLLNQVGYEPRNNDVVFTSNIYLLGITKVDMELCVFDMSSYSETDVLPVPSSMEADIVNTLVAQFSTVIPESGKVNLLTTDGQQNK